MGDITGVINGLTGELVVNYVYDAFGNTRIKTPNNTLVELLSALTVLISNPLTYRGYMYSFATGYSYYLGSRFYVPNLCRFMNADVYADTAQGIVATNMFAYCNNNPINYIDPKGKQPESDIYTGASINIFSYLWGVYVLICAAVTGQLLPIPTISIPISSANTQHITRTKTLSDTRAKLPQKIEKVYCFAYINKYGELITSSKKYTYVEIVSAIGVLERISHNMLG